MASGWKNARQLAFMANAFKAIRIATEDGDIKKGVLPVGQVTGLMRDIPSVAEAIERTVREAEEIAIESRTEWPVGRLRNLLADAPKAKRLLEKHRRKIGIQEEATISE
ncbi:MAG: hypothetical protein MZV63_57660 [Marinilabiliales bacterium]|nr:hypothetical protein [Marinilabiliales bacterium]